MDSVVALSDAIEGVIAVHHAWQVLNSLRTRTEAYRAKAARYKPVSQVARRVCRQQGTVRLVQRRYDRLKSEAELKQL